MTATDPNSPGSGSQPPGSSLGLRWAFGVSLAINLLVVGIVAGAFFDDDRRRGPGPGGGPLGQGVGPVIQSFAPEDRRQIARNIRRDLRAQGITRSTLDTNMIALAEIVEADPFDPAAVQAALSAQMMQLAQLQDLSVQQVQAQIVALSPDERQAFGAALRAWADAHGRSSPRERMRRD